MEAEIRTYILGVVTGVMNIHVDDDVADDAPIGPDGIDLDSLSLLELVANLEKQYGFEVADEEYEHLALMTLGELVEYTAGRQAQVA